MRATARSSTPSSPKPRKTGCSSPATSPSGRKPRSGRSDAARAVRQGDLGAGQPRAVDHDARPAASCAARRRYEYLVDLCRGIGVLTPEDEYPVWHAPVTRRSSSRRCSCSTTTVSAIPARHVPGGGLAGPRTDRRGLHRRALPASRTRSQPPGLVRGPARAAPTPARRDPRPTTARPGSHFPLHRGPDRACCTAGIRHVVRHRPRPPTGTCATAPAVAVYGHLHIPRTTEPTASASRRSRSGYPREWRKRARGAVPMRRILWAS